MMQVESPCSVAASTRWAVAIPISMEAYSWLLTMPPSRAREGGFFLHHHDKGGAVFAEFVHPQSLKALGYLGRELRLVDHHETPGLAVTGGGGDAGRLQAAGQLLVGDRAVGIVVPATPPAGRSG